MKAVCYLTFDGTAEAAFTFYAQALGGELTEVHRFGGMPGSEAMPPALAQRVMHVGLTLPGGATIMASDTMPGMGPALQQGNHVSISLHPDSREQADRVFAALAEGGEVKMPLEDQFWGDYYGHLVDRFGVQWMVNHHDAGATPA